MQWGAGHFRSASYDYYILKWHCLSLFWVSFRHLALAVLLEIAGCSQVVSIMGLKWEPRVRIFAPLANLYIWHHLLAATPFINIAHFCTYGGKELKDKSHFYFLLFRIEVPNTDQWPVYLIRYLKISSSSSKSTNSEISGWSNIAKSMYYCSLGGSSGLSVFLPK